MQSERKMNPWLRGILVLLVVAVALTVGYQIVRLFLLPVQTQTALEATVYDTVQAKFFIVRDEQVVPQPNGNAVVPAVQNGERVGKNNPVALMFANTTQADGYLELQQLKKNLARYEIAKSSTATIVDIKKLNQETNSVFCDLLDTVTSGQLDGSSEQVELLLDKLTLRQIATSGAFTETDAIRAMRSRRNELEQSCVPTGYERAKVAGYFVANTDGLEHAVSYKAVKKLSVKQIEELQNLTQAQESGYGKLIGNFRWYLVTAINSNKAAQLKKGSAMLLLLDDYTHSSLDVTLDEIGQPENGKTPLIFSCNRMDEVLCEMRLETARIAVKSYTGLKISREAVRVQDGEQGVFIKRGNIVNFRRLDVIYETDEFVVAVQEEESKSKYKHVNIYDEVITRGKNIYDRKVV